MVTSRSNRHEFWNVELGTLGYVQTIESGKTTSI